MAAAAVTLGASAVLAGPAFGAATLNGAGSTLVYPIESEWASAFQAKTGNSVNYNPVGSGTGITDISQRLVDFGASDAPLTSSQAAGCGGCVQIPWAVSATGVGFNIPGVRRLRLTGPVLAQIYLGQITNWSDGRIRSLNPGLHLPSLAITPIHRSDGSGDTYAFTNYLTLVSTAWKNRVNYATSVSWPSGPGAKGNSGVQAVLVSTPGSIAYVAVSYLIAHGLPAAAIRNNAGRFEYPNLQNIDNAANTVHRVPAGNAIHIVNPPRSAKIAYPISTFTYAIVPRNAPQGGVLRNFISFAISRQGQSFGPALDFGALPPAVVRAAQATLGQVH